MEEVDSAASGKASDTSHCASCGIAESDDIKLTTCAANCNLVRYCSVACQEHHRSQHEAVCKKRVAELRDDLLFTQPDSNDCPICFLPLPIDKMKRRLMSCCSKVICDGCIHAGITRLIVNGSLQGLCPFCRHAPPATKEEAHANVMRRADSNDPAALFQVGSIHYRKAEYNEAFRYWSEAANLGDAVAHQNLSVLYREGKHVEMNEKRATYHLEEAAIAGQPDARFNLTLLEWYEGSKERAMKHFIIAAILGEGDSVKKLMHGYKEGIVSKDDFAAALRAHQAAVDAMKSPQREAAEKLKPKKVK